jgi:hypothetical protein
MGIGDSCKNQLCLYNSMMTQPYNTPYRYLSLSMGWLCISPVLHCCLTFCRRSADRRSRVVREPTFLGDSEGSGSLIRRSDLDWTTVGCDTWVSAENSCTSFSNSSFDTFLSSLSVDNASSTWKMKNRCQKT